jgi:hypothetical protein
MHRDSTPVRRMKQCRIWYRPAGMPTLIAYPPPPPERRASTPLLGSVRERTTPATPAESIEAEWPPLRPRTSRRRRDCVFIPDMDIAMQFIEARRFAAELAGGRDRRDRDEALVPALPVSTWSSPIAIGLLMTFLPPLAVTLVWYSPSVPRAAQLALTAYGTLVTLVLAALAITAMG